MPEQTTLFEQQVGDRRVVVLKTFDESFARHAFDQMTPEALSALGASLELESKFDPSDIPTPGDINFAGFLWSALQDDAREDWNRFSYFIAANEDTSGLHPFLRFF